MIEYNRGDACLVLEGNGYIASTTATIFRVNGTRTSVYILRNSDIKELRKFGETNLDNISGWWIACKYITIIPRINKIGGKLL